MQRMQATELPRAAPPRRRRSRGTNTMLMALLLFLFTSGSHSPLLAAPLTAPYGSNADGKRTAAYEKRPHSSSFALAAELLETAACRALSNGQLLSAAWALSKALVFWTLHAGHTAMPNATVSHLDFATYHIDAALIDNNRARLVRLRTLVRMQASTLP
eukprot:1136962-Pleurochrysis_carterae.AAC.2